MRELTWKEKREQRRIQREGWKEMVEREKENPQPRESEGQNKMEDRETNNKKPGFWKEVMQDYEESQARKEKPHEFRTVRRMKDAKRLMKKGWEVVESSGSESFWGHSYKAIMRRPNPRYKG